MRNIVYVLALGMSILFSCGSTQMEDKSNVSSEEQSTNNYDSYGDKIDENNVLSIAEFKSQVEGVDSVADIKISTKINSCCQKKGCWMNVDMGDGEEMKVRFKDYGFFVPLDAAGSEVIMQGKAFKDTISVDMLRHYAEDAGKSEEEINAITEPESVLAFEASGVLLKK